MNKREQVQRLGQFTGESGEKPTAAFQAEGGGKGLAPLLLTEFQSGRQGGIQAAGEPGREALTQSVVEEGGAAGETEVLHQQGIKLREERKIPGQQIDLFKQAVDLGAF